MCSTPSTSNLFSPEDIREAVTCYFESGGKRLRPAVMLFCCGAGGRRRRRRRLARQRRWRFSIRGRWSMTILLTAMRPGAAHRRCMSGSPRKPSTTCALRYKTRGTAEHYGISIAVLSRRRAARLGNQFDDRTDAENSASAADVTLTLIQRDSTRAYLCTLGGRRSLGRAIFEVNRLRI
jgi:hypothetical protein